MIRAYSTRGPAQVSSAAGVDASVGDYEYELRRDGVVIATGRIHLDDPPSPGDELTLGAAPARVEEELPLPGMHRLILEQT